MNDPVSLRVTVDEIEISDSDERIATLVADGGSIITAPIDILPPGTRVNDVLALRIEKEANETQDRWNHISDLQQRLFGRR